jgi:uncharacterized protein YdeI (YjbR/CyaY-like superfamily)
VKISKTLYVTDREAWRKWLAEHYASEKEIWLLFTKKASGKPRIPYNDAVEEALCFGWIDSTVKKVDEVFYAQRFSPRNPKSSYSQSNKERLARLLQEGKVIASIRAALGGDFSTEFVAPSDILEEIKANKTAWENYKKFSPEYQRIRVAFIDRSRQRPSEFKKRLNYFIKMTEANKQFGFGGIQKYYNNTKHKNERFY